MIPRSAPVLVLIVVAALVGPTPPVAAAKKPVVPPTADAITNVTASRSLNVFAGVLPAFTETFTTLNTSREVGTITDANGNANSDSTTDVAAFPGSLSVTGSGVCNLTVAAATAPPATSDHNETVNFTTTVPTDFSLKGTVSATNLALPSDDVASCTLTGPGVSYAFGKLAPGGPWMLSGDFSGVLPAGTYQFSIVLQTRTVNSSVQQQTAFADLDFSVKAFAGLPAGEYVGLCTAASGSPIVDGGPSSATTPSNDTEGFAAVKVTLKRTFKAVLFLGKYKLSAAGTVDGDNRFLGKDGKSSIVVKRTGKPDATLTLIGNGTPDKIMGTLVESGTNATSTFDLDLAVYTSKPNPVAPLRNPPAALMGEYTVIFPPVAPGGQLLTPTITTAKYPQGTGWATLTVDKNGVARLKGKLADGTAVRCVDFLSKDDRFAFYVPLYGKAGSISGSLTIQTLGPCLVTAPQVRWFAPANARAPVYPAGWPSGIVVDVMGGKYVPPAGANGPIPGIPATPGAASVVLSGADLVGSPITSHATIDAAGKTSIVGDDSALKLAVAISAKSGTVTGSFVSPGAKKPTTFSGVIVQSESKAFGFFVNAPQSGEFVIE